MNKGFSLNEAKIKVSEIQKSNANKNTNYISSKDLKHSLDYWTSRNYTKTEAEILRKEYLAPMLTDLNSMIKRHGNTKGTLLYNEQIRKYKESMLLVLSEKKTGGYVSKESLKFFIPLYKMCRRLGIERSNIYIGVKGSKEFFIRDNDLEINSGIFCDFTIPSLKLVIEYNGLFWHPRNEEEWKNPWLTYEDALVKELRREKLCKDRGFELIKIWSDYNQTDVTDIYEHIKRKYYEYIKSTKII